MLKIQNLCVSFNKEFNALQNISMIVEDCDRVALLGGKESGKTTLLRILAKLEDYTSGDIYINNKNLRDIDFQTDVSLAYITKNGVFLENKSIIENLNYVLKIRGVDENIARAKVFQALSTYDLNGIKEQKIKHLSDFQKLRVQLARVSLRAVDYFLIDNVFENLSSEELGRTKNYIRQLIRDNKKSAFIICTEDENLANFFCERIIKLSYGSIVPEEESNLQE